MEKRSIEALVRTLNAAQVRYMIAGGFAVIAHGHVRLTRDVDLILDLREDNVRRAVQALSSLDYRPIAPVPLEQFAETATREQWLREKQLKVFSLVSPTHQGTTVDLFVEIPFDFDEAYARALHREVLPNVPATFIGIEELLFLKKKAGRPKDLEDVRQLEADRKDTDHG